MGSDDALSPPTPPALPSPSPSPSSSAAPPPPVPLPHPSTPPSKLALENQSLKRRLIQYASTLEKLTLHARREIDASARARDDALSSAASTASLRDALSASEAGMAAAQAATVAAMETIAARDARISELEAERHTLQRGRVERDADRIELVETRERLGAASRELAELRDARRDERDRADKLHEDMLRLNATVAQLQADNARLSDAETARAEEAAARAAADAQLTEITAAAADSRADRDRQLAAATTLQTELASAKTRLAAAEARAETAEADAAANAARANDAVAEARSKDLQAGETTAALRRELDESLLQLADAKSDLDRAHTTTRRQLENDSAVRERDQLRANVSAIQDELEQSTELLTRAAIDALSDKERIRKLDETIAKTRDDLQAERAERRIREHRVESLTEEIHLGEKELEELRAVKRETADDLHRLQMHINEQESLLASRDRSIDELSAEQTARASEFQRVSLDLSNAKNSVAKQENDAMRLRGEYNDVCKQLKDSATELEDMHNELAKSRRDLTACNEQISDLMLEQERSKATLSELQVARRQLQELTTLVTEKDEELTTMKRWYTNLKAESGESSRERKRLSDMLSDVTNDLKRANHELDILRGMRKDQEVLAARISHIGETSTRELSRMRQTQTEQAEVLAKNTVQEYHDRISSMQHNAKTEIAATVTEQLRQDLMPHLMRAVDSKAKHMVHALAKHVESFAIDTDSDYSSTKAGFPSTPSHELGNVDSVQPVHTNVASASGGSQSQYVPTPHDPATTQSTYPSRASGSAYRSVSPEASREIPHERHRGAESAEASRDTPSLASPEVSVGASYKPTSVVSTVEPTTSSAPSIPGETATPAEHSRGIPADTEAVDTFATSTPDIPAETLPSEVLQTEAIHEGEDNGEEGNTVDDDEIDEGGGATEDIETINIAEESNADNIETLNIAEDVDEEFIPGVMGGMEGIRIVEIIDEDGDPEEEYDDDEEYAEDEEDIEEADESDDEAAVEDSEEAGEEPVAELEQPEAAAGILQQEDIEGGQEQESMGDPVPVVDEIENVEESDHPRDPLSDEVPEEPLAAETAAAVSEEDAAVAPEPGVREQTPENELEVEPAEEPSEEIAEPAVVTETVEHQQGPVAPHQEQTEATTAQAAEYMAHLRREEHEEQLLDEHEQRMGAGVMEDVDGDEYLEY